MSYLILLCVMISERIVLETLQLDGLKLKNLPQILVLKSNMRPLNNKAVELYTSLLLDCV